MKFLSRYFKEFFYRLFYASLGTVSLFFLFYKYKHVLLTLILPDGLNQLVALNLTEILAVQLQLCFYSSLVLGFPVNAFQIYAFLRPALSFSESMYIKRKIFGAIFLYFFFFLFFFPMLAQFTWDFFFNFTRDFVITELVLEPRLSEYLNHLKILLFASNFFLFFFFFLVTQTIIHRVRWLALRRAFFLFGIIFSAAVTPSDIFTQVVAGGTLIVIYEAALILKIIKERYKKLLQD